MFRGEIATDNVIDEVAKRAAREAQPITDVRSTADYRRQMSEVLVKRLIKLSIERAKGNRN